MDAPTFGPPTGDPNSGLGSGGGISDEPTFGGAGLCRLIKSGHVQPEKQNLVEPRAITHGLGRRIYRPCKHRWASKREIRLADGRPGPVARRENKGVARLRAGHSWFVGTARKWRPKGQAARQCARQPGATFGRLRPAMARSCDAAT